MPSTEQDDAGVRRVRTTEGARFFGIPVGEVIGNKYDPKLKAARRSTSLTRLVSLQRQFAVAKKTGNLASMHDIQALFTAEIKNYAATNGQLTDVLDTLIGARGRADQVIGKKKV